MIPWFQYLWKVEGFEWDERTEPGWDDCRQGVLAKVQVRQPSENGGENDDGGGGGDNDDEGVDDGHDDEDDDDYLRCRKASGWISLTLLCDKSSFFRPTRPIGGFDE